MLHLALRSDEPFVGFRDQFEHVPALLIPVLLLLLFVRFQGFFVLCDEVTDVLRATKELQQLVIHLTHLAEGNQIFASLMKSNALSS